MLVIGAVSVHFCYTLGDLGQGYIPKIVGIGCAAWISLYLVDFAWMVDESYVQSKSKMPNWMLELFLIAPFVTIGVIWYFLL